ncbi:hypothetical protein ES703_87062 [subsurface metagenome]
MKGFNNAGGRPRKFCLSLFVCLSVIITSTTIAAYKNNQEASKVVPAKRKSSGSYCGIYCLYTTMKLADKEIDFRKLLKPEYIGSRKGSSLAELKKASEDNGLYALPMGKLTSQVLRSCPHSSSTLSQVLRPRYTTIMNCFWEQIPDKRDCSIHLSQSGWFRFGNWLRAGTAMV